MRIIDGELEDIIREYRILHDIRKASDAIKKERTPLTRERIREINRKCAKERIKLEQAEFLRKQIKFINNPGYEKVQDLNISRMVKTKTIIPKNVAKKKRRSANRRGIDEPGCEKYSGIMPGGDSGREPRKQDWNDEIARNFQKELRKIRNARKYNGLDGVDRGALK